MESQRKTERANCRGTRAAAVPRTTGSDEIKRYLIEYFGDRALEDITQFELQVRLNKLAKDFSDPIVRHTFSNLKAIFRTARKMKFIAEDPAEDLRMPDTRIAKKPKIAQSMMNSFSLKP